MSQAVATGTATAQGVVPQAVASPAFPAPRHEPFRTSAKTAWYPPGHVSAGTIGALSAAPTTLAAVIRLLERLEPDDYSIYLLDYLRHGLRHYGAYWGFRDLLSVAHAAATLLAPRNYLEIGVRRGRSLAAVATAAPQCSLWGFDLWMAGYAGMENPGPKFVEQQLRQLGCANPLTLVSGDSHETVPQFLAAHPGLEFDMICVDGDHTDEGARADLRVVLPRLRVGGAILLDDIAHPLHRNLLTVWEQMIGNNPRFTSFQYGELGYGVAVGIRRE